MNVTKIYIGLYKLKKCIIWQFRNINITALIIIFLLLSIAIFQQFYYPRIIQQNDTSYRKNLNLLQFTYGNITNAMEDLKAEIEDYNSKEWRTNIKNIKLLIDNLDEKISYYESSIFNYYSPNRAKRQKLIF
jgi:hypothetical protein